MKRSRSLPYRNSGMIIFAKTMLVAKLTIVISLATCLQVSAEGIKQNISILQRHTSLENVFKEIHRQSGYQFFYQDGLLNQSKKFDINVKNASIEQVLLVCFKDDLLDFTITEKSITIKSKGQVNHADALPPVEIRGRVINKNGEPLPNVSVLIVGTKIGASTDNDGRFKLNVPNNKNIVLEISSIGLQTQTIKLGKQTEINITMEEATTELNQVVAIGYGTQKKTTLTGAVSTIKSSDLDNKPVADITNLLVGRVAGLIVTNESGQPGYDGSDVLARGRGSNGGVNPLTIVDGVPREYSQLDPSSIESFSILKDAAAVAPYGMAGANGVILITTKRGKSGVPRVSFNAYYGLQNNAVLPKLTNAYDNAVLQNQIALDNGSVPLYSDEDLQKYKDHSDPLFHPDHNAVEEIFSKNAPISKQNLSITGGSETVSYYVNIGHLDQQGVLPNTNFKRYNLVANVDINMTKSTKFSASINGRVENRKSPDVGNILKNAYKFQPMAPLKWPNGLPGTDLGGRSPFGLLNSGTKNSGSYTSIYSQLALEQQLSFIKGLSVKGVFNYDPEFSFDKNWNEPYTYYQIDTTTTPFAYHPVVAGAKPSLKENFSWNQSFTYQGFINYHNIFGKHDIKGLVVLEARSGKYSQFGASRNNYSVLIPELNNGSSSSVDKENSGFSTQNAQRSSLFRATYNYASKYLLEVSGRFDANYYFAPGHRTGFFPAISAGWRLAEEDFIRNSLPWISELKIRGSYGESGALPGTPFQYLSTYTLYGGAAVFGDRVSQGLYESIEPNAEITWERSKKSNIGLETNIKNGLFTLTADYFFERRTGMLIPPKALVPAEYGVQLAQKNYGAMNNHGVELTIGSSVNVTKDLIVGLSGNFTYVRNKLTEVAENASTYNNPNRRVTGRPLGTRFGYHALGLFQLSDDKNGDGIVNSDDGYNVDQFGNTLHPGDIKYQDINGDNQITSDDEVSIGTDYIPEIIYGFGGNLSFKGFTLDFLFQGAAHRNIYLEYERAFPFSFGSGVALQEMLNYWTPENPNAKNPWWGGDLTSGNSTQRSDWWNADASYLRLKSATLGYTFPASMLKAVKLENLRVYVSGTNLLTKSPFTQFDPELSQGEDFRYPQQRVISFGFDVTF